MNIIKIIENIESLIVGILFSIIYIPKTLFRIITKPFWVPDYISAELKKNSDRFENYISPVILYIFSSLVLFVLLDNLLINNLYEESFMKVKKGEDIMGTLQSSNGILVGLAFLSLPLLYGFIISLLKSVKLKRSDLKRLFYIQCYYFTPLSLFVLLFLFSTFLVIEFIMDTEGSESTDLLPLFFTILFYIILIWICIVQVKLIALELKRKLFTSSFIFLGIIVISYFLLGAGFYIGDIFNNGERKASNEISYLNLDEPGHYIIRIECQNCVPNEPDFEFNLILKNYYTINLDMTTHDYSVQSNLGYIPLNSNSRLIFNNFGKELKFQIQDPMFISVKLETDKGKGLFVDVLHGDTYLSLVSGLLSHQSITFRKYAYYVLTSLIILIFLLGFRNMFRSKASKKLKGGNTNKSTKQ